MKALNANDVLVKDAATKYFYPAFNGPSLILKKELLTYYVYLAKRLGYLPRARRHVQTPLLRKFK